MGVLEILEYVLRIAFFLFVPFGVVLLAMLVPMGAAIVQMILALAAFFLGEMLVATAEKRPWLKRVLRRQLAFEAYYRQHPPRPFLYYMFYPFLFPYWLWVKEARREFVIFKGYTIVTVIVISGTGVYHWFFVYQPEIGIKTFVVAFGIQLVVETLAVLMLIMPMTTSVVALHRKRQQYRLIALLAAGLLSAGVAGAYLRMRHRSFPSLETRQRVVARNTANHVKSKLVMKQALEKAWKVRRSAARDQWERETDGTVTGAPLDDARDVLESFYRDDEAGAFELWTTARTEKPPIMIVFAEGRKKGNPVWLGLRPDGTVVDKITDVPRSARRAMRTAGEL
jgi:hypothetical protein